MERREIWLWQIGSLGFRKVSIIKNFLPRRGYLKLIRFVLRILILIALSLFPIYLHPPCFILIHNMRLRQGMITIHSKAISKIRKVSVTLIIDGYQLQEWLSCIIAVVAQDSRKGIEAISNDLPWSKINPKD